MAHIFEVTVAEDWVYPGATGTGEACFNVRNVSESPVRGRAVPGPENSPVLAWLKLMGEQERLLQPNQSDTFLVKVAIPPGTSAGDYSFRLDILSVARPYEDSTQGPTIKIPVTLAPKPPKRFPKWILVAAAVVIVGLSIAAWKLISGSKVTVPDLHGKTVEQAEAVLAPLHLKLETQTKAPADKADVDRIIGQTPAPDSVVPPDTKVSVRVGIAKAGPPPRPSRPHIAPPSGEAAISNSYSGWCLSPAHAGANKNDEIVGSRCDRDPARLWTFQVIKGDVFKIVNSGNQLCLTVAGGNTVPADPAVQYYCDEDASRRWQFVALDETTFRLVNGNSKMCLAIPGTGLNDVAVQNPCDPNDRFQEWRVILAH